MEFVGPWELASLGGADPDPVKMQLVFRQMTLCRFPELPF